MAIIALLFWLTKKSKSKSKRKRKKKKLQQSYTSEKAVAYIILKDGHGKFGITVSRENNIELDITRRYSNKPLKILWAKILPTRAKGYEFEAWCKTQVRVLKGREWFHVSEAHTLAQSARHRWGS